MSTNMSKIGGMTLSGSASSVVSVAQEELQSVNKIPGEIFAQIIGLAKNPGDAVLVSKLWKERTLKSYKEILASYPRDPYSLTLLELATRRVIPTAAGAFAPEGYRKLDDVTCHNIFKTIKIIQDENLHKFFWRLRSSIADGIVIRADFPCNIPGTIHEQASAMRRWMTQNQEILSGITTLNLTSSGLQILPPEIGLFGHLARLKLTQDLLTNAVLPETFSQLAALRILDIKHYHFPARPDLVGRLLTQFPQLTAVNMEV